MLYLVLILIQLFSIAHCEWELFRWRYNYGSCTFLLQAEETAAERDTYAQAVSVLFLYLVKCDFKNVFLRIYIKITYLGNILNSMDDRYCITLKPQNIFRNSTMPLTRWLRPPPLQPAFSLKTLFLLESSDLLQTCTQCSPGWGVYRVCSRWCQLLQISWSFSSDSLPWLGIEPKYNVQCNNKEQSMCNLSLSSLNMLG